MSATDLVHATRLAVPCRSSDIGGKWITGTPNRFFFVMQFNSGGTSGRRVQTFEWYVNFGGPACSVQNHLFYMIMDERSRLPVYLADIDEDGVQDILVAAEVTNQSGAPDTPQIYRVFSLADGSAKLIKEIEAKDVVKLKDRELLR